MNKIDRQKDLYYQFRFDRSIFISNKRYWEPTDLILDVFMTPTYAEARKPPKPRCLPKNVFFLIERDAPNSLLYSPLTNVTRKISFMQLLRYWTRLSVIWDHPAHCSEVWFRNSNFSGTRTIQFNDQKCFSATFHCFHTAGLLRKWNLKKW